MPTGSVVVVEDDPTIMTLASAALEDAGVSVVAFTNADDALAYMYDHAAEVSAIFTDLQMPGQMDGLLLAEIVGRHWPKVTILLTSGRVKPIGRLPDNVRFISKPWLPSRIIEELQAALATGQQPDRPVQGVS